MMLQISNVTIKEPPPPITSGELDYSTLDELDAEGFAKWLSDAYAARAHAAGSISAAAIAANLFSLICHGS